MSSDDSDAEFFDARESISSPRPSQSFQSESFPDNGKLAEKLLKLREDEVIQEEGSQNDGRCDDETDSMQPPNEEGGTLEYTKPDIPPVVIDKPPQRPSFESTEVTGQTPDLLACVQDRPTDLPGVLPVDVVTPPPVSEKMPPPSSVPATKPKVPPPRPAPPKRPPPPRRTYLTAKPLMSESDDGLLTPNSTVDNLTREFTEALKKDETLKGRDRESLSLHTRPASVPDSSKEVMTRPPLPPEHTDRGSTRKGSTSSTHTSTSPGNSLKRDEEILSSVIVRNLDTGESMPLSTAAEQVSKCLNPLALQIMSRTREFSYTGSTASIDSFNPQIASALDHTDLADSDSLSIASDDIYIGKDASETKHRKSKKMKEKRKKWSRFVGKGVSKVKVAAGTQIEKAVHKAKHMKEEVSHNDHLNVSSDEDSTELGSSSSIKIKASSSNKGPHHFSHPKQVQDIAVHVGAVWCMKFSHCGRLLATAGQDNVIWVWVLKDFYSYFNDMRNKYDSKEEEMFGTSMRHHSQTSSLSDQNQTNEDDVFVSENPESHRSVSEDDEDSAPFRQVPFSSYVGHSADVLDLAWSKNFFILSSSMDKTVRLWHISRKECLCCFQHIDFVTAIAFHPRDDRYFLSGSLDSKLRLWNIPDKKVALWNEVSPDGSSSSSANAGGALITTVNFCENGKFAVCGTYDGRCIFFDTEHLKYHTQIHVRSSRGRNTKGHKITGIEPLVGEHKILITSNDSRVRLYDLRDLSLVCKYKGHSNTSSQIKASFSPDSKYIICGSEDKCVYIWRTSLPQDVKLSSFRRDRNDAWESMKTHDAVVTCAVFAPQPQLLYKSESGNTPETKRRTKPSIFPFKKQEPDEMNVIISADFKGCIKVTVCADG